MQFTRAPIMGVIFIFQNDVYAVTCGPGQNLGNS